MQKKKNVLLLCLSVVNLKRVESNYSYMFLGKEYYLRGLMTNEAPAESVIERLNRAQEGRLDSIVLICSQTTQEKIMDSKDNKGISERESARIKERIFPSGKTMDQMTHLEYYREVINEFAEKTDMDYKVKPISYNIVPISDVAEAKEIAEAAVQAANSVMIQGNNVDLYIDYNGGPRYVAFMILSISNLMKIRKVNIKEIMTMNYDNQVNHVIPIQNMEPVFECMDLVAGINEYVNYGRAKVLKNYFKNSEDKKIKEILNVMEEFSNSLQLCRTEYVFENKKILEEKLYGYLEYTRENPHKDTLDVLFSYVVQDILDGCSDLLDGDMPEVIKWCVKKDFIQQALTFYAERMPVYFWDSGIFHPTVEEGREYNSFIEKSQKNVDKELTKFYRYEYEKYNKKYCWMAKYITNSCKKEYPRGRLSKQSGKNVNMNDIRAEEVCMVRSNLLGDAKNKARNLLGHIQTGRVETSISFSQLKRVLTEYFLIKEQRNTANHASDNQKDAENILSYDKTCALLCQAAERIHKVLE